MKQQPKKKQIVRLVCAVIGLTLLSGCASCRRSRLPAADSPAYRDYVRAFYVGLSALQAGDDVRAKSSLDTATNLVPDEPAGWVNLAILELKQKLYEPANAHLEKARLLAPELGTIYFLQATLETNRGNYDQAIKNLRRAIELNAKDVRSIYALAQELERQGGGSDQEALTLYRKVLDQAPSNTAAMLEVARLSAKRGDTATLSDSINRLRAQSTAWPPDVKTQFSALETAAAANPAAAATQVAFLRNVLLPLPEFRQNLLVVKLPPEIVAEPLTKFLKLAQPRSAPAPPDTGITYATLLSDPDIQAIWAGSIQLRSDGPPLLAWQEKEILHVRKTALPLNVLQLGLPVGIATVDINYDFLNDIVMAGAGLRFYRQVDRGEFTEVTATTKLPDAVLTDPYSGVWAADIDLDGDQDLVLSSFTSALKVLQNNGDGTFTVTKPINITGQVFGFAYGDLNEDGAPDAAVFDLWGNVSVFGNSRGGKFNQWPPPFDLGGIRASAFGDVNGDGKLDLVTLDAAGVVRRSNFISRTASWETKELVRSTDLALTEPSQNDIQIADLDNNGSNDILLPRGRIYLSDETGKFSATNAPTGGNISTVADFNDDGLLDLGGLQGGNRSVVYYAKGTKNYHWQAVRPHAATATGDQRINPFGIGGEMELRAGLLYQKQLVTGPVVHFGLGDQPAADVIRIVWPNGSVQAEFDMKPDQSIAADQRLKGSCPHLFAWDGTSMRFIKDAPPWSPALGLKINAQVTAGIGQTEEWFKLPGDAVAPAADGQYDLRITAELWETFYIDRYSLLVVDHTIGTEAFTDERFVIPAPKLKVRAFNSLSPFLRARDDNGNDVAATVDTLDDKYLDNFSRGPYQGVARDHFVELEIPADIYVDDDGFVLVGQGWLHPTDASINVAIGQGHGDPPRGLSIEVPNGKGGWRTAKANQGFPAGKLKNVLLDLTGVFTPGTPRVFRLRTNMEIYWDRLAWTVAAYDDQLQIQRLELSAAELSHRGFSVMTKANASSPEIPHYDQIETTGQKWRDLEGYYTRFGDILELLDRVDGRFVLVNAGDEIRLRFAAAPPPVAGMVRDFILVGNGWIKDGDLNSGFSKTVLPLPTLDLTEYTRPPGRLEDEPAYRANLADWQNYHTRYVAPDQFQNAMRPNSK
ncbi:MAG: FG-GAP-like repeat-containing protein [Pyrinomonadaceae bacterium]